MKTVLILKLDWLSIYSLKYINSFFHLISYAIFVYFIIIVVLISILIYKLISINNCNKNLIIYKGGL